MLFLNYLRSDTDFPLFEYYLYGGALPIFHFILLDSLYFCEDSIYVQFTFAL